MKMRRWQVLQRFHIFSIGDVISEESDGFKAVERWIPNFVKDGFLKCIYYDNEVEKIGTAEKKFDEMDLNRDGKVDKKDVSLAAKVLGKSRAKKKPKKKGGKKR